MGRVSFVGTLLVFAMWGAAAVPLSLLRTTIADPCISSPCLNGGTCVTNGTQYSCRCSPTLIGSQCQYESIPKKCSPGYCLHNGNCSVANNMSICSCPSGWAAIDCSSQVVPGTFVVDVETKVINPNTEIGSARNHSVRAITDFAGFSFNTGTTDLNVDLNGHVFALDNRGGGNLVYQGIVTGSGDLHLYSSTDAALVVSGSSSNTFSGITYVHDGLVLLAKSNGAFAVPGDFIFEPSEAFDALFWNASNQVSPSGRGTVLDTAATAGSLVLGLYSQTLVSLNISSYTRIVTYINTSHLALEMLFINGTRMPDGVYRNVTFISGDGYVVVGFPDSSSFPYLYVIIPLASVALLALIIFFSHRSNTQDTVEGCKGFDRVDQL